MTLRLLLIDDEDSVAAALPHDFRRHAGWTVDVETDARKASTRLAAQRYDLVVLDIALTGPTIAEGLALVAFAREQLPRSRILVFTAFDSPPWTSAVTRRSQPRVGVTSVTCRPVIRSGRAPGQAQNFHHGFFFFAGSGAGPGFSRTPT